MARDKRQLWSRAASLYDNRALQTWGYRPIQKAMIHHCRVDSPGTLLDIGCGTGQLTRQWSTRYPDAQLIGLDYASGMVKKARHNHLRWKTSAHFIVGNGQSLPFADQTFDLVSCANALIFMSSPEQALAEIARVLRPGGAFTLGNMLRQRSRDHYFQTLFEKVLGPMQVPSLYQLEEWVCKAGLHIDCSGIIHTQASRLLSFGYINGFKKSSTALVPPQTGKKTCLITHRKNTFNMMNRLD